MCKPFHSSSRLLAILLSLAFATTATAQPVVPPIPELPWRSTDDIKTAQYAALGESFVTSLPGDYWYVCPAPQRAQEGMYGKFIVQ